MSLRNWRRLTNRMRLRMAIAEKRSLGTWCKWIGVLLFASLGLVVMEVGKQTQSGAEVRQPRVGEEAGQLAEGSPSPNTIIT
jgi:hypothetical protein